MRLQPNQSDQKYIIHAMGLLIEQTERFCLSFLWSLMSRAPITQPTGQA